MRVLEMATRIDMPAQQFWALRMDPQFDQFCAKRDSSRFELVAMTERTDAEGNVVIETKGVIATSENILPASLQSLLGARALPSFSSPRLRAWYAYISS